MVKLAHDGCLAQEVLSLSLCVASFEGLDGHRQVPLAWHLQPPIAYFSGLPCGAQKEQAAVVLSSPSGPLSPSLQHQVLQGPHSLPLWPQVPSHTTPLSQPLGLTRAYDLLNMDPGCLDLSGEAATCPTWLLIGVGLCTELGFWELPRGVIQG